MFYETKRPFWNEYKLFFVKQQPQRKTKLIVDQKVYFTVFLSIELNIYLSKQKS